MMNKKLLAILILGALLFPACSLITGGLSSVKGSGNVISETRPASGFTSVVLDDSANVEVVFGSAEEVVITGEDNIIFLFEISVEGDRLVIKTRPRTNYQTTHPVHVKVTAVSLESVGINGSGNMNVPGISGDSFDVDLSGSGNITLSGETGAVSIELSGSGNIDAGELEAQTARVEISGSGNITVFASEKLDAAISGSGDIRYRGNPPTVNQDISGSGSVHE